MVDTKRLAGAVRAKRGRLSLRKAADGAGVSYVTLQKIENEGEPDLVCFMKVCEWLGVPMDYFRLHDQEVPA